MSTRRPAGRVPVAVPEAVAALLAGPRRRGRVLGRLSLAAVVVLDLLGTDDGAAPVLTMLAPGASGTPHGLRVLDADVAAVFAAAAPGCAVTVGGGGVQLPGLSVRAVRTVPSRIPVAAPDPAAVRRLAAVSAGPTSPGLPDTVRRVRDDADPGPAVRDLLGRGPGLTPTGDDLLAGLLCGLWATGRVDVATRVGDAVRHLAPGRTTTFSADLLRWAALGHAGSELLTVLRAARTPPGVDLDRAARELLAVGHTSGADLLAGLVVGLSGSPQRPHLPGRCPPPDGKDGR